MSKKIVLALIVILLAGGGFYFYRQSQIKQNPTPEQSQSSVPAVESVASSSDRYQPYSSGVLAKTSGNRRVLYFYASWCPTCHPADADFVKNESDIPEDVRVIRINYNDEDTSEEETALAAQYKITYQHTFVQIDAEGNVITQWNGGQTADLIKNLK